MRQLKMAINDINEFINEEYGNQGFHSQKLAKDIYKYLIGDFNSITDNWFKEYGHLFLGWENINKICEEVRIIYISNKGKINKN